MRCEPPSKGGGKKDGKRRRRFPSHGEDQDSTGEEKGGGGGEGTSTSSRAEATTTMARVQSNPLKWEWAVPEYSQACSSGKGLFRNSTVKPVQVGMVWSSPFFPLLRRSHLDKQGQRRVSLTVS